jgi:TPR repeat protein
MHLNGTFVLQDYNRAAALICAAAEQGDANGQFNCGLLYAEGKGVPKDPFTAVAYWAQAAEANHVAALNFLARSYRDGDGVAKDIVQAFSLFSKTASAGNPLGLYEVAKAYAEGSGVFQDRVQAHGFANLAAVRGLDDARKLRDALGGQMSASELEAAQQFARSWKAAPLETAR